MRGFINANYDEADASSYQSFTMRVGRGGISPDCIYTYATGNPVADYLTLCRDAINLLSEGIIDYVSSSSDVDHFVSDSDFLSWKVWPDDSERFIFDSEYTWGWTSHRRTGLMHKDGTLETKSKWMRSFSPQQRNRFGGLYEITTVHFFTYTPLPALRWMAQQLQEGRVDKPESFEGQTINVNRKGERI